MDFIMLDYSFRVYEAMKEFNADNIYITGDCTQYFSCAYFFEAMYLTYLHVDCEYSLPVRIKSIAHQYDRFGLRKSLKRIKFRDLPSLRFLLTVRLLPFKLFGKHLGILSQFLLARLKRWLRP